jgi:hypothetical protein
MGSAERDAFRTAGATRRRGRASEFEKSGFFAARQTNRNGAGIGVLSYRSRMRWMLLALIATACTEGSTCPGGSVSLGTFTLSYTQTDGGDTCAVTQLPDGGATNTALFNTPSPTILSVCGPDGGGPGNYTLQLPGTGNISLDDGGTFDHTASGTIGSSPCNCTLGIAETFSGKVVIIDGGGAQAFAGHIDENVSAQSGTCLCNTPCGVHYSVSGSL